MYKIRPYVTEKSVNLAKAGKFSFVVAAELDKVNIIKMLKNVFKVHPVRVRLVEKKSMIRKTARRKVRKAGLKKAIVELQKGEKIPGFEIIEEKAEKAKKVAKAKNE